MDSIGYKTKSKRKSKPRKLTGSALNDDIATQSVPNISYPPQDQAHHYQPVNPYGFPVSPVSYGRFSRLLHPGYSFENDSLVPTRPPLVAPLSPSMITGPSFHRNDSGRFQELQVSPSLRDQSCYNGNGSDLFMEAPCLVARGPLSFENGGGMGLRHFTPDTGPGGSQGIIFTEAELSNSL